ncbi:MAG: hypothetical protein K2N70_06665, partial [Helicobacter sp.]|nr:hypothetical protein [Helicobacter sp.]
AHAPQRLRLCYAFWLEHRRCALWLGLLETVSNSRIGGAVLTAHIKQYTESQKIPLSLRASNASVAINNTG